MSARPEALIFDVFGTIVDWRSGVAAVCRKTFEHKQIDHDPHGFADLWRDEYQPAMERIRSGGRGYVALDILHRENLDRILDRTGLAPLFSAPERDTLNRAWEQLPPWTDSVAALDRLKQRFIIAPCSNGSIALMTRLAKFGGLPWDAVLGAEIAGDYKPRAEVYLASCAALGLPPSRVMMVAAHNDDLVAARAAGLQTGFFPRPSEHGPNQTTDLENWESWDLVSPGMASFASTLCG